MAELSIYEYEGFGHDTPRKLVIAYRKCSLEVYKGHSPSSYLVPFSLMGDDKPIISFAISPNQIKRIATYLKTNRWDGGILCPRVSSPSCYLIHLDDLSMPGVPYPNNIQYGKHGIGFELDGNDKILVEWIPENSITVGNALSAIAKAHYELREIEPDMSEEKRGEVENWKRKLFEVN